MEKAKFCVDCEYCNAVKWPWLCEAPVPELRDLVTGEPVKTLSCKEARLVIGFCGRSGEWFDPKRIEVEIPEREIELTEAMRNAPGKVQVIAGRGDREVKR